MANDFSGDANCKALWRFESGALTTDSSGNGNTLTEYGEPAEQDDCKEGEHAVEFEIENADGFYRTDAGLSTGFPLKYGESNLAFTICAWGKVASLAHSHHADIFTKTYDATGLESMRLAWWRWNDEYRMTFVHGFDNSYQSIEMFILTAAECVGVWNHFGFTYNDATKAWTCRRWNDSASEASSANGVATNNIQVTTSRIGVGCHHWGNEINATNSFDGILDEIVVFNRVLSVPEIDKIRQQTYTYRPHDLRLVKKAELPT